MNWADRLAKLAQALSAGGVVPDANIDAAIARDSEVTSAVSTHAGASDPHADRSFATSAVSTHAGAADPHTGYQLESGLAAAITATKLDDFATPDDNTDLNVATTRHGLAPKLPNDATKYFDGIGGYTVPPGTGLTNPMTTAADLIVGGASGVPARLAKGADGTVLTVDPTTHLLVWTAPTGGGAPTDATYLVTAANAGLSAEVVVPAAVLSVLDDITVAAMVDTLGGASSTGTGGLVRATSPTLVTPALGTPASGVATNLTGTAASLTAGNVTTNANLTGVVTSVGNATNVSGLFLPYRTGGTFYYTSPYGVGSSLILVQDKLYAFQYFVPVTTTFDSIAVMTAAGVGSSAARLGIYSDASGVPASLVLDAGSVATTSGGAKAIAISQSLTPGWYWLACAVQGAAGSLWSSTAGHYSQMVPTTAPFSGDNAGYSQTGISGTLPSPWGATKTEITRVPVVWIAPH